LGQAAFRRDGRNFIEFKRVVIRLAMWTAPEGNVNSFGCQVAVPEINVAGTGGSRGGNRKRMWITLEGNVGGPGGDATAPEIEVDSTGDQ
jgi:hypothetical protein